MQRVMHTPDRPYDQTALFRPSLAYPTHPYDELLMRTAQRFPEHAAVVSQDSSITYRELEALVNAFANGLLDVGVHRRDCVCLLMTNRPEFLISWFAITRIGAVVSTMNPSYKDREVSYQIDNSEAVAVVVQHDLLPLVETRRAETPCLKFVIVVGSDLYHPSTHVYAFSHLVRTHPPTPPPRSEVGWEDMVAHSHQLKN